METLWLALLLAQVSIPNDGPIVIPAEFVVRGLIALMAAYSSLLYFCGKWIWKQRGDEVTEIKNDVAAVTEALKNVVNYETYRRDKGETRQMINELGKKVDRHHESIMEALLDLKK